MRQKGCQLGYDAAQLDRVLWVFRRKYPAKQILDDPYKDDLLSSSFSVIRKGARIQLGEGEGPTVTLENDAASQYVCQTDAVQTLIYKNGKWVNIYDE